MKYFPGFESIINWEPYSFDGTNTVSTGVLCKWENGRIDYFDPEVHTCEGIRFIESDEPKSKKNQDDGIVGNGDDECGMITFLGF